VLVLSVGGRFNCTAAVIEVVEPPDEQPEAGSTPEG
jgi:hypothetical protein